MNKILILCSLLSASVGFADERHEHSASLEIFYKADPGMHSFLDTAYAYVIYPRVAKGGFIVGGAGGDGMVFERTDSGFVQVGTSELSQGTIGFQIGGEVYSELVVFEDAATFDHFKKGKLEFSGNASGVVAKAGGAAAASYHDGVAIFITHIKGLMGELSIGAMKLSYRPLL
jgi:lipid-binding SYLF domain-containing protein